MENSNSSKNKKDNFDPSPPPRISLESEKWTVDTDEVELNADQEQFDLEVGAVRLQLENHLEELSTSNITVRTKFDNQLEQPSTSYASTSRHRENGHNGRTKRNEKENRNEKTHESRDGAESDSREKRRGPHERNRDDSPSRERRRRSSSSERSRRSRRKRRRTSSSSSSSSSLSSSSSSETDNDEPYFWDPKREKDRVKKLKKSRKKFHTENKAKRRELLRERSRERRHNSQEGRNTDRRRRSPASSSQRRDQHEHTNYSRPSTSVTQPNNPTQIIIVPYGHNPYMASGVPPHAMPFLPPQLRPRMHGQGFYGPPMQMQPRMPMQPQMQMLGLMGPYQRPFMMPPQGRFPDPGFMPRQPVRPRFWKKKKKKIPKPDNSNNQ